MNLLQQLAQELETLKKHTTGAQGSNVGPYVHGPNSLFGVPGLERDVISSRMTAQGLASLLPAFGEVTRYPLYPYITGYTAPTGEQDGEYCTDAPIAGSLKSCLQTAKFGLTKFMTREVNLAKIGSVVNAGERTDLNFVNDPLAEQMGQMFMNIQNRNLALRLGREVVARFVDIGNAFQDELSMKIYTGTGQGADFLGLEGLVTENHFDAETGQNCESLASDVRDFEDVDISTEVGSAAIVNELQGMYRFANHKASGMRLGPVNFAFVMHSQWFTEITDIWACAYASNRCNGADVAFIADGQVELRAAMRQGSYLLIDNVQVPVIQDDYLNREDLGGNTYSSDIYLLPLNIRNNRPSLYWEHFAYDQGVDQALLDGRLLDVFWIDGGRYLVNRDPIVKSCVTWQAQTELRLRLETPQIAGRLLNVAVSLDKLWYSPTPLHYPYADGGVSSRPPSIPPYS